MDTSLAHRLSVVAGEVYRSRPRLESVLPGATVRAYHNDSTQCFLIDHPSMVVIAFRGTEPASWRDWWTDAQALSRRRRPNMPGTIHYGFAGAVDALVLRLFVTLARELGDRPLYLTGHSLGGALAVVFAADLIRWRFAGKITGIYTFGAPRVLSPTASRWLDRQLEGKIFQVVNPGDFVPRLPPAALLYRHVGERIKLEGKGPKGHGIAGYTARLSSELVAEAA